MAANEWPPCSELHLEYNDLFGKNKAMISSMKNAIAYLGLFVSFYYAKRNNPRSARKHLNKSLRELDSLVDFVPAYNARVLMMEGKHQAAKDSLKIIIEQNSHLQNVDKQYIAKYSEFFLAIYDKSDKAWTIKSDAMNLDARGSIKKFLPLFSDEAISRILS